MGSDGRLLGVLSTHFRSKHRPSNRDLRLLDLYAQQAANFIERTRTDEQLRESEVRFRDSEARMRAIVDTAVDAILVINDDGLIGSANPAAEALFGYTAREMVGQNVKMLMPEPYAGEHDNYIRHYRQTGQRKIIGIGREVTGRRKDGSTFPMHLSVSECEIAGKCHFAGIIRDLTAREKAEADRLRQQTLFEATVNDAPQAIIVADPSRNIFLVNPAVSRIFAYAPPELIGQSLRVLYAGDEDYERIGRLAEQADATEGHAEPIRASFRRKNGELFPGELIATIIRDQQRNILGVMRFVRDISGQLKQEQVLRQNQRMDALGQLTGGIAHDFNNLLTVIMGSLELVEGSTDPQQTQHLVREANDAAKMGARLTNRLLSFSRQRKLEPAVVNLNELTSNVMDMLRRSIGETIAISTSLASNLRAIRVDPSEIENTILNLAVNSRDAMPHGGKLIIETQNLDLGSNDDCGAYGLAPGTYVRMSVSDTGTGMPPEVVARAFEPFFTTKPLGRGNGLGLASIYGFVKQSGGNATIYSEPGRGTTVHLYLPSIGTIEAVSRSGAQARSPTGTGETILVVEDNPQLRKLTLRRIELLGYRVLEADDGPSALAILDGEQVVQLIFSDVVMPGGMTGYELAQRAKERHPSIKVLLTSGYDAEQAAAQASTRSELRVLRKPYKQADLANALCAVLLS
jgi:PAS domain S-box-containing protein